MENEQLIMDNRELIMGKLFNHSTTQPLNHSTSPNINK